MRKRRSDGHDGDFLSTERHQAGFPVEKRRIRLTHGKVTRAGRRRRKVIEQHATTAAGGSGALQSGCRRRSHRQTSMIRQRVTSRSRKRVDTGSDGVDIATHAGLMAQRSKPPIGPPKLLWNDFQVIAGDLETADRDCLVTPGPVTLPHCGAPRITTAINERTAPGRGVGGRSLTGYPVQEPGNMHESKTMV